MKKKNVLKLGIAVFLFAILWMRWHEHTGLVCPNKPVWKSMTGNDFSNMDTALARYYQHHNLVYPKTIVWKESFLDDSANTVQKTVR